MIDNTNFIANILAWLNTLYVAFIDGVQPIIDLLGTKINLLPGIDPALLPDWALIDVGSLLLGVGFLALIPIWIIKMIL